MRLTNIAGEVSALNQGDLPRSALDRPKGAPAGYQRWNDLLFLHWPMDPEIVQATLPRGLTVDTFDDGAWLGIVPFFMERIRPAFLPPLPWVSWFLELNVRTYAVDEAGRAGVWFYSLDCNQPVAVWVGRTRFHLPYFHARMRARRSGAHIAYRSSRRGSAKEAAAEYVWTRPAAFVPAKPGTLEFFLVERYRLFAVDRAGGLWTGQVRHVPYRVAPASLASFSPPGCVSGFSVQGEPVSALAAAPVDVDIFPLRRRAR